MKEKEEKVEEDEKETGYISKHSDKKKILNANSTKFLTQMRQGMSIKRD